MLFVALWLRSVHDAARGSARLVAVAVVMSAVAVEVDDVAALCFDPHQMMNLLWDQELDASVP